MTALVGILVPAAPWSARLVGAGSKAVSLLHPDGALVSVVARKSDMEARAMGHGEWARFRNELEPLLDSQDAMVGWDGSRLLCAGRATLDFSEASVWDPRPLIRRAGRPPRSVASMEAMLQEAMRAADPDGEDYGIHGGGPFASGFAALEAADGFPANLVGFGPGTTPAGDDWLAGYLAAADMEAGTPGQASGELRERVAERLGTTTAAGRSLLLGALAGIPPAYIVALALALATGGAADLEAAVRAALGHGASSGRDALSGLAAGIRAAVVA
ncbi:MAG TPA: DUF2877 domain-containing protein [Spirochaetales bacterium]|nr:DUF2877 domain-containing protein [Spirochaetales bacterium]